MRIGIMGVGYIGATLAQRLPAAGHQVKVANSRGPETISPAVLDGGARAVTVDEVVADVDALILSIPMARIPDVARRVGALPVETVVLDTSNYYPARDRRIDAIESGQVESLWVVEQLGGRPIVKAWNAIGAGSFARKATTAGTIGRIAIPVAADSHDHRAIGMSLVDDTGFDGFDAGTLADSWRQQPGTPAYCNDLTSDELAAALTAADRARSPKRRDLMVHTIMALADDDLDPDFFVRLGRVLNN